MTLNAKIKFVCPKYADSLGLIDYKSNIVAEQEGFEINDFEKQAYALRIINNEIKSAVKRVNERLLAEGFGKESFRKPLLGLNEYGGTIDLNVP